MAAAGRGLFVTGTDTEAGKTVAAAWLVRRLGADYFKPVQAGLEGETDEAVVRRLTDLPDERFHPSTYLLRAPMSPHAAARREGIAIDLDAFRLPGSTRPVVVEGAGGILVPLHHPATMADLMVKLALPVVLVSRTTLGTINHTLLSLECLRRRGLDVAGVIFSGEPHRENREAIEQFGNVTALAEIPWLDPLDPAALDAVRPREGVELHDVLV
jgi:dethiobiotin synthase